MRPQNYKQLSLVLPFIPCPNCKGRLLPKEKIIDLCNIQCVECHFAARFVMLNEEDPLILSINDAELAPMLAQKVMLPPFIFHRTWKLADMDTIFENTTLYPFIPYTFLKRPSPAVSLTGQQQEDIHLYVLDDELANEEIYSSPSDEELAREVSTWSRLTVWKIQIKFNMEYARAARVRDEANKIRRRKGLPVEDMYSNDDDSDEEE